MASYDDTATVSGSVVSIENGADEVGAKSCVVTVSPTLSGVSSVTETQTEKTIFYPMDIEQGTISGSGYNSNSTARIRTAERKSVTPSTEYKIKVNSEVQIYEVHEYTNLTGSSTHLTVNASEYTFTTKSTTNYLRILFRYSNNATITPSAITELQVTDGNFYWKTYTASLGRTIYGGTADIVNGTGKDTTLRYELDENDSWSAYSGASHSFWHNVATGEDRPIKQTEASESICNYATYSSASPSSAPDFSFLIQGGQRIVVTAESTIDTVEKFKTWLSSHNLVFVCPSTTPTDFTFTGQEIPTRLGYNAFWSDQGDTELTYYKDGYGFTSVTVNKTGKNLFNKNAVEQHTWIIVDNTETETRSNINYLTSDYIPVHANTRYYVSAKSSNRAAYYDRNKNGIAYFSFSGGASFNCLYDGYIRLTIKDDTDLDTFVVNEGSEAIPYEPFGISKTAKLHKVIYGGEVDVIRGTCEPKNLGELSEETYNQYQKCTWEYITGGVIVTATGTYARVGFSIPVETGKTYTISYRGFSDAGYRRVQLNSTPTWSGQFYNNILTDTDTAYSYTFTSSSDTLFVGIYVTAGTTTGTLTFSDFMLVEGNTAEDYVPHFEPFSFPPISMETDDGENTLFANEGASAITYRKETD